MAVDSLSKRFSMLDFGANCEWAIPIPDGAFNQGDRQHFLWGYSGINWANVDTVEILIFQSQITTNLLFASEISTSKIFQSQVNTTHSFDTEVD